MQNLSQELHRRTASLLGESAIPTLHAAHIAVFGIGGVGGYVAEGLGRSGIGSLTLVDGDVFSPSNLNRQLFATTQTLSQNKAQAAADILKTHAPQTVCLPRTQFLNAQTIDSFPFSDYDYVVDAVDDMQAKILLAQRCAKEKIPLLCALGAGNKLNPCALRVCDLSKTDTDPLARSLRRALGKIGIRHVKTVCSCEPPRPLLCEVGDAGRNVGSAVFVPAAMGMAIAAEVVADLCALSQTPPYAPYGKVQEVE